MDAPLQMPGLDTVMASFCPPFLDFAVLLLTGEQRNTPLQLLEACWDSLE